MSKIYLSIIFLLFFQLSTSQEEIETDSILSKEKKIEFTIDLASRYIWRGQSWGGNYPVIQPTIIYNINKKLSIGTWFTSNFQSEYFYSDGTFSKGYQEIDLFLIYKISKIFSVELWDYYWPTVSKVNGIDNSFFNYGNTGVKSVDLIFNADFSEVWLPIQITSSILISGNDFKYDNNLNPKRNFTSYVEISYVKEFYEKIELRGCVGAVLNNKAGYYTYSNYDNSTISNINLKTTFLFSNNQSFKLPVWINYIHNASTENTNVFGKNFLVFGFSVMF